MHSNALMGAATQLHLPKNVACHALLCQSCAARSACCSPALRRSPCDGRGARDARGASNDGEGTGAGELASPQAGK